MSGAIPPLPQLAFMAWCSVKKKAQGQIYLLPFTVIKQSSSKSTYLYCMPLRFQRVFNVRAHKIFHDCKMQPSTRWKPCVRGFTLSSETRPETAYRCNDMTDPHFIRDFLLVTLSLSLSHTHTHTHT
jgi:hypothetical protein